MAALTYQALEDYTRSQHFNEVNSYIAKLVYRVGSPGPCLADTHTIFLQFAFNPNKSSDDHRRQQFELVTGGVLPHQVLASKVFGPPNGPNAEGRRQWLEVITNPAKMADVKGFKPAPVVVLVDGQIITTRNFITFNPLAKPHATGWLEFAQKAFKSPTTRTWRELYELRSRELGELSLADYDRAQRELHQRRMDQTAR